MSLKQNIIANYLSQIYVTVIGIVIIPLYLRYMGPEAYGLVGFFSMLQSWFNLLDVGLTPTIARETARFRGGALDALTFRRLVRTLEGIFLLISLLGGSALLLLSDEIATSWLTVTKLSIGEVQFSLKMMAITISFRWMSGLYRGQISGSERIVWLSCYNVIIATLRYVGVFGIISIVSPSIIAFFVYQLFIALIEFTVLMVMSYQLLPRVADDEKVVWSWEPLKSVLKFSFTIAFTSSVWVVITQADKLVISKVLPLAEYGYFTLAVLVANGIMIVSGPVSGAIIPRMTKLEAEKNNIGLIRIYHQATQLVSIIAGSAAVTISFSAVPLLYAWTGDKNLANHVAPILILYAIGNGVMAISAFPYYLQYAKGNLRLHFIGNALFVVLLLPTIILASRQFGSIGAGYVWLGMNLLSFVAWLPLVHRKLEPGLNFKWYCQDILVIILSATIAGYCMKGFFPQNDSRGMQIIQVIATGFIVLLASLAASSEVIAKVSNKSLLRRYKT